jgi:hypothetical protein
MNKKRLLKLKKISGVTSTQPLYETLDGKEFTVSDIVQGKIKSPKAYRGKSLSHRYRIKNKKASAGLLYKKSYSSGNEDNTKPVFNMPSVNIPPPSDYSFGWTLNDHGSKGPETEEWFLGNDINDFNNKDFDLINYLIDLSNKLDINNGAKFSNFVDFLIKKSSETGNIDYSNAFNDLIIKINESDIDMKNNFIKKITNKFSRLVNISISNGDDISSAKIHAYKKCLLLAESYMV